MRLATLTLPAVLLLAASCAPSLNRDLAIRGDWTSLRARLADERVPSKGEIRDIARAVLGGALSGAKGRTGEDFVSSLATCAVDLDRELTERAGKSDDVGYAAALLRLDTGRGSLSEARALARSTIPGEVALYARSLVERSDGEQRRALFVHPEGRVRRAALEAAMVARDPGDVEALLDVARLDPEPMSRVRAFSTLAAIGGGSLATRLHDRFASAGEDERLAIIDVWASPGVFLFGGRERLSALAFGGPENGLVGVVASERLSRLSDAEREKAHVALERALVDGTLAEQRFTVRVVSLDRTSGRAALERLVEGTNEELRILAAARFLERPETKERGFATLRSYEGRSDELGRRARAALSAVGRPATPAFLRQSLRSADATERASAGRALIRLGKVEETAILLADPDEAVRTAHACVLLTRTR